MSAIRRSIPLVLFLFLVASSARADHPSLSFGTGAGGPIHAWSAMPLPRGSSGLGFRFEMTSFDHVSDEELAEEALEHGHVDALADLQAATLTYARGLTKDVTLAVRLPHVVRDDIRAAHLHFHDGRPSAHAEAEGDSSGIGDLLTMVQWRVAGDDRRALAIIGGIEAPTGRTDARTKEDERFEAEHQPGSGSWDVLAGLAASGTWGRSSLHGDVTWLMNNEGSQDTELGDVLAVDLAFVHHFGGAAPHDHVQDETPHSDGGWELVLELNGEHRGATETAGNDHSHDEEESLWFSPGFQVGLGKRWSINIAAGVPLWTDVGEHGHEPDWRASAGFGVTF